MTTQDLLKRTAQVTEKEIVKLENQHEKLMKKYKKESNWGDNHTIKASEIWKEIDKIETALIYLRKSVQAISFL